MCHGTCEGKATPIAELGLIYHHIKCM